MLGTPVHQLSLELSDTEDMQLRDATNESSSFMTFMSQPCSQPGSQVLGTQDFCTPADEPEMGFRAPPIRSPNRAKRPRPSLVETCSQENGSRSMTCLGNGSGVHIRMPQRARQPVCLRNVFLGGDFDGEKAANANQLRLPMALSSRFKSEFKEDILLGEGSFAQVIQVKHRVDGREYAIKRSRFPISQPSERAKWIQEIQAWAALPLNKSLVRYYGAWFETDAISNSEHAYIQLERCGPNLADMGRLARGESIANSQHSNTTSDRTDPMLKEAILVNVLRSMAEALTALHGCKMVHMDIKPENIYASVSHPEESFKLGDFGLATTSSAAALDEEGDARYLAREVLNGDTRHLDKGDMFALGASLYELATGCLLPQDGAAYQDLRDGKLKLLPVASVAFSKIIADLMHPDAEQRPSARKILMSPLFRSKGKLASTQHNVTTQHRGTQVDLDIK